MLIRASLFIPITLLLVACESATDVQVINTEPMQWLLPPALNEASGLALADNGSIYIHNDELGEIYRFIPRSNSILKVASISWPPVGEDFEGIAVHQDSLFLITSDSQLFEVSDFSARENHQVVGARRIATGLQAVCEFEGLYNLDGKLLTVYIRNTILLSVGTALLSSVIGLGNAWIITRYQFPFRKFLSFALILPLAKIGRAHV